MLVSDDHAIYTLRSIVASLLVFSLPSPWVYVTGELVLLEVYLLHANTVRNAGEQAVWVCNCKHFVKDHIVAAELDEAERNLRLTCSDENGGFVWSRKWQKSINCKREYLH